ncbi:MAG: LON peptidase substrate-binding domain-containing protein [Burkholderiaceae bacterium]
MTESGSRGVPAEWLDALALFPLSTVLFPGGVLPLRIFEARYTDMVRECMRQNRPFGVCLITKGGEVGETAEHEPIGCLAYIQDVDMEQPGVLRIRTVGSQRFRVGAARSDASRLIRAQVHLIDPDPLVPVPSEHAPCVDLVRRMVQEIERTVPDPSQRMIAGPMEYESAAWVANRIAEFLPIPGTSKYRLMTVDDPADRLAIVHRWLSQQGVL